MPEVTKSLSVHRFTYQTSPKDFPSYKTVSHWSSRKPGAAPSHPSSTVPPRKSNASTEREQGPKRGKRPSLSIIAFGNQSNELIGTQIWLPKKKKIYTHSHPYVSKCRRKDGLGSKKALSRVLSMKFKFSFQKRQRRMRRQKEKVKKRYTSSLCLVPRQAFTKRGKQIPPKCIHHHSSISLCDSTTFQNHLIRPIKVVSYVFSTSGTIASLIQPPLY